MQVDDRIVNLSPGMAVTVEIKTGSRRILSYLLSPLLRYQRETCASGEVTMPDPQAAFARSLNVPCVFLFAKRMAVS
jgi:hypothetical protein